MARKAQSRFSITKKLNRWVILYDGKPTYYDPIPDDRMAIGGTVADGNMAIAQARDTGSNVWVVIVIHIGEPISETENRVLSISQFAPKHIRNVVDAQLNPKVGS